MANTHRSHPGISQELLAVLRCTACRGLVEEHSKGLACSHCGLVFPEVNGVVRFVSMEYYAGSFGFQWKLYARTQLDNEQSRRSEQAFRRRTGFGPEDLAGKLVLDVGCGMGRFAEVATRWGARVVGIDLSVAAEVAAANLASSSATVFQADVFQLPFADESFDYIYSIGVLHHTPDCQAAFKMLPPLLKPGGRIAVWLYSGYNHWYSMSDVYRKITRRMSPQLLHKFCYGVVPLYALHKLLRRIPLVGRPASGALAYVVPMAFNPDPKWRILDTFDWYSPWYQSKHTYEEVFRWFESCGLRDLSVIDQPVAVQGRKAFAQESRAEFEQPEVERCVE